MNFDKAIELIEKGHNPEEILKKVSNKDKDAVRDYIALFEEELNI